MLHGQISHSCQALLKTTPPRTAKNLLRSNWHCHVGSLAIAHDVHVTSMRTRCILLGKSLRKIPEGLKARKDALAQTCRKNAMAIPCCLSPQEKMHGLGSQRKIVHLCSGMHAAISSATKPQILKYRQWIRYLLRITLR